MYIVGNNSCLLGMVNCVLMLTIKRILRVVHLMWEHLKSHVEFSASFLLVYNISLVSLPTLPGGKLEIYFCLMVLQTYDSALSQVHSSLFHDFISVSYISFFQYLSSCITLIRIFPVQC